MFKRAGQPELVRSNQKDVYFFTTLRETIGQIFRDFGGVYSWIRWKDELEVVAEVCYFGLTTLCGFQTLGEEYCNIVQVDISNRTIPTTLNRCMLIFLQTVAPYLLNKLLAKVSALVQTRERWPNGLSENLRIWLQDYLPVIQQSVLFFHRAHLTIFYLTGVFYHISKRITSINYILVRSGLKDSSSRPTYKLLGYISAMQLILTVAFQIYQKSKVAVSSKLVEQSHKIAKSGLDLQHSKRQLKCSLCLESLHHVTATPCGHLFDWECITEWCSSKPECPLCRDSVQVSRLVYLHNFDPT